MRPRGASARQLPQSLVREEINQDNLWVVRLRTLPDTLRPSTSRN